MRLNIFSRRAEDPTSVLHLQRAVFCLRSLLLTAGHGPKELGHGDGAIDSAFGNCHVQKVMGGA